MARIAVVSQWLLGHIVPALGIGAELARRGHEVSMLAAAPFRALIEQAGLKHVEIVCGKYPHKFMEAALNEIDALFASMQPDLVLCDSALSAPAYAAEKRGLPWVSYQTAVYIPDEQVPGVQRVNERLRAMYRDELNALRQQHGLPPLADEVRTRGDFAGLSADLHLMLFLEELLPGPVELPRGSRIVGPCTFEPESAIPLARPARSTELPNIIVCTSSADKPGYTEKTRCYLEHALAAFPEGSAQLYMAADAGIVDLAGGFGAHVRWVGSHPNHHLLFPYADVIVTHGGCGTLQKAIRHGVPTIIIPLGSDHIRLAERCAELGIAKVMSLEAINAESLRRAVQQALADQQMKQSIARLSGKVDEQNSNRRAADEIEKRLLR
ncbi:glycosyltransferase [Xylanibacillus composti]|uniref:Glycosyl transferase n=1 Tax=Xylanibacillus composti TaxID=1572762 RepID=A0A8J4H4A7_9BACL|nr:glycosyltransferase [Xylanibacillus composti]MDT9726742.1 glycosyltransferase [Xylanibacillus composti]GIQ69326.1 glycosyl transferase [Xylanibacillus composti]